MTNQDAETVEVEGESEDNVVVLATVDAPAPGAEEAASAAKKPAAKKPKAEKKPAAKKPKAEKKPAAKKPAAKKPAAKKPAAKKPAAKKPAAKKPKAEKKPKVKRAPGTKAQTQVPVDAFKYVAKAAKEDGAKPADFVRDAVLGAIDKRFGTTYIKDAKAAAKAAA